MEEEYKRKDEKKFEILPEWMDSLVASMGLDDIFASSLAPKLTLLKNSSILQHSLTKGHGDTFQLQPRLHDRIEFIKMPSSMIHVVSLSG